MSGRARVDIIEIDLSARVPSFPGIYGAMVLDLKKGQIGVPVLNTSEDAFFTAHTLNGDIEPGDSLGLFEAQAFLRKSNKLWTVRPDNDARYGGAWMAQDVPYHSINVSVNIGINMLYFRTTLDEDKAIAEAMYPAFSDGDIVRVTSETEVPAPLVADTPYYVVKKDEDKYGIQLALTLDDAYNGNTIDLTTQGNNVMLTIAQDKINGEQEYPVLSPESYMLDTSDGKPAGWNSDFHVDFDGDAINVSEVFYNTCSSGDEVTLVGNAEDIPVVDSGLPITTGDIVYLIKLPLEGQNADKFKVQIARTLLDAQSEINIGFMTKGGSTFALQNASKIVASSATIDITQDNITAEPRFTASLATNDRITISGNVFPTYDGGQTVVSTTEFYAIYTSGNSFLLATERNGVPINFESAGDGIIVTNLDKAIDTVCNVDLSLDTLVVSETFYDMIETGYSCNVKSDGTLPTGLMPDTTYYIIKTDTPNIVMLATTPDNAELGITVDIVDEGVLDPTLNQYHIITDTHNAMLSGFDMKVGYLHTSTPCEEEIFYKTLHYPYGTEDTWSDSDQTAAETVKEPGAFMLWLYKQNDAGEMVEQESYLMSRDPKHIDGYGANIYCENVALRSNLIRWIDNTMVDKTIFPVNQTTFAKLTNGSEGHTVTTGEAILALKPLENKRKYPLTIIMDAGRNIPAYQQALIGLCEYRWTSMAILSTPITVEQSSNYLADLVDYRRRQLITSTSHAAIYSPHLKVYDSFNDREIYVSPTGHVGAQISETAANYEPWYAPAGATRGVLNVLGLSREFTDGDMDYLYDAQINPIQFHETKGIRIWGQRTLLTRASALDRVNVRMLLIVIEDAMDDYLDGIVFEFNDAITRGLIVESLTPYLEGIQRRRGIYDFKVVCDTTNNTNEVIDANELIVDVWLQAVKVAEFLKGRVIITRTGATFGIGI